MTLYSAALGVAIAKPYTPRTNGKAERFIQTLCREWAYGMSFQNSEERKRWLPRYLRLYNQRRCHKQVPDYALIEPSFS